MTDADTPSFGPSAWDEVIVTWPSTIRNNSPSTPPAPIPRYRARRCDSDAYRGVAPHPLPPRQARLDDPNLVRRPPPAHAAQEAPTGGRWSITEQLFRKDPRSVAFGWSSLLPATLNFLAIQLLSLEIKTGGKNNLWERRRRPVSVVRSFETGLA